MIQPNEVFADHHVLFQSCLCGLHYLQELGIRFPDEGQKKKKQKERKKHTMSDAQQTEEKNVTQASAQEPETDMTAAEEVGSVNTVQRRCEVNGHGSR